METRIDPRPRTTGSGAGLKPGDDHYRAFVGPPEDYDLVAAMVFNLLTCAGLRQQHRLLDIGCGSLRAGRLLIPYLDKGHYIGVEPNRWLVDDGILNEIGADQIRLKAPVFSCRNSLDDFADSLRLDYAVAQSIFSHCSLGLIGGWLGQLARHLNDTGVLLATFLVDGQDFAGDGWIYPDCVKYRPETMSRLAAEHGFGFEVLDFRHPRQTWAAFYRPRYDRALIAGGTVAWSRAVERTAGG